MKTRLILITAMIVLSGSLINVSAQNTMEKNSPAVQTQQARFGKLVNNQVNLKYLNTFENSKPKLVVQVKGESGELLYSKRYLNKRKLDLNFDISDFPKGGYTFNLYQKNELLCSKVIEKQNGLPLKTSESRLEIKEYSAFLKTRQARFCNNKNDQVNLQFIDTKDENRRIMEVRILKESDNLLYTDSYFRKGDLNINFDISKCPTGDYTFQFYNENELVCSKIITKQDEEQNEKLVAILYSKSK